MMPMQVLKWPEHHSNTAAITALEMPKAPVIAEVTRRVGWARLWDATLDIGGKAVRGLQMLSRVTSHHGRGS